jgi:thiamine biosynthesis protein ThiS
MGDFVRVATAGELPDPGATVVEVDGDVIPRAQFAGHHLVGGEQIEIVTFVGGG